MKAMTKLRSLVVELRKHGFVVIVDGVRLCLFIIIIIIIYFWARKTKVHEQHVYLSSGFASTGVELNDTRPKSRRDQNAGLKKRILGQFGRMGNGSILRQRPCSSQ